MVAVAAAAVVAAAVVAAAAVVVAAAVVAVAAAAAVVAAAVAAAVVAAAAVDSESMYIYRCLFTFILVTMLSSQEKQYLENIWSDPKHPAAFSGPEKKLYKFVKKDGKFKIGLSAINRFLSSLEAYSQNGQVKYSS